MIRLTVALLPRYVQTARGAGGQRALLGDVERRLVALGAGPVLALLHDPTDDARMTALTTRVPDRASDATIAVLNAETVEAAPSQPADPETRHWQSVLDAGLTPREARAVGRALERETNPRHLGGFGSSFEPSYPVAATLLRARAMQCAEPAGVARAIALEEARPTFGAEEVLHMRIGAEVLADQKQLPRDLVLGEVRRVACTFGEENAAPPPVLALGRACLRTWTNGTTTAVRELVEVASPTPEREESSAVQLALAAGKPGLSRVWNQDRAGEIVREIESDVPRTNEERIARMRARLALERAHRTLDRQRWVSWYEQP